MIGREYGDNRCPGIGCADDYCTDHGRRNPRSPRYAAPLNIPCCTPARTRGAAHEPEIVYVAEQVKPATRTALVLGVRVEIPLETVAPKARRRGR